MNIRITVSHVSTCSITADKRQQKAFVACAIHGLRPPTRPPLSVAAPATPQFTTLRGESSDGGFDVLEIVDLRKEYRPGWKVGTSGADQSGRDDDTYVWPPVGNLSGQFPSVDWPGHVHIREHHMDIRLFRQYGERFNACRRLKRGETIWVKYSATSIRVARPPMSSSLSVPPERVWALRSLLARTAKQSPIPETGSIHRLPPHEHRLWVGPCHDARSQ